ncbi:MAG: DNA polymerase III subunit [Planctomycetota bacterium]|jgi:DNA polymerase-3 subunit delta'
MAKLSDIVGQQPALTYLQGTLTGERRPHAYIFAGPDGVGRQTTANALAATLLCSHATDDADGGLFEAPPDSPKMIEACGQCDDCRMMEADSHPDFHLVYKELARFHDDADVRSRVMQDLGINVVRSFLIAPAGQAPARGRGKVFVVCEAELLSIAAQNALLKTLEEPPSGVTIILLCRDTQRLLPTTLSRCALVRFGPLPEAFVTDKLIEQGVNAREASFWATFTEGSVGRALALANEGMYPIKRELLTDLAGLQSGGDEDLAERLAKTTDGLAEATVARTRKQDGASLSKALATRQATGTMLQLIASIYRDAVTARTGVGRPFCHADQSDAIETIAGRFEPTQLADILEHLGEYERMLWQNVNPKIVWDNVVMTCASAAPLRA